MTMNDYSHKPVMTAEVLEGLMVRPGGVIHRRDNGRRGPLRRDP